MYGFNQMSLKYACVRYNICYNSFKIEDLKYTNLRERTKNMAVSIMGTVAHFHKIQNNIDIYSEDIDTSKESCQNVIYFRSVDWFVFYGQPMKL